MRTTLKILLIFITFALIGGCCSQKCAKRRLQRLVKNHPELVQPKKGMVDTWISVPGYVDISTIPRSAVSYGELICKQSDHGTFFVGFSEEDSSLTVGYLADTQQFHYQDDYQYDQIVIQEGERHTGWFDGFGERLAEWISFLAVGMAVAFYLLRKHYKNKN